MKTMRYAFVLIIATSWISSFAQNTNAWDYGLSANVGLENFKVTSITSASKDRNNSDYAVSAGFWAERHLGRRFSAITGLSYSGVKVGYNIFTGGLSKDSYGDIKENHGYVSISERGRFYFAEKGKRKLFLDIGLKLDKMIFFKNSYARGGVKVWNPKDFGQLNPGLLAGFGISKGRWRLSADYQYFLGTSLSKDYRENLNAMGVKWDVDRQNFSLGAAFMLNRPQ